MKPWLSQEELFDLTGYKVTAYQARWLSENGFRFTINGLNKVRVLRDSMGAKQKTDKRTEPDFTKVRKAG